MLPPRFNFDSPALEELTPSRKLRFANFILSEGLSKKHIDVRKDLETSSNNKPHSQGTTEFLSKFSIPMKEKLTSLALSGFSEDPQMLITAVGILSVLNPHEDEKEILAELFDGGDRLERRTILTKLFDHGCLTISDMSRFITLENDGFPNLPYTDSAIPVSISTDCQPETALPSPSKINDLCEDDLPPDTKRSSPPSSLTRSVVVIDSRDIYNGDELVSVEFVIRKQPR